MARPIAAVGEVEYNGFDFPGPVQCRLRMVPVYDGPERIVKYRRYTLTVECVLVAEDFDTGAYGFPVLSPGDPLDTAMAVLRYKLTQSGKTLKYKDQGIGGDITVTQSKDIEFGPKPQLLALDPMGSRQAWHLVWEVQFTPKECSLGISGLTFPATAVGEWWYSVSFNIAPNGLTERTISGQIEALVTRNLVGGITYTADMLREKIKIPRLLGFNRTQNFDVSPDKRFLRFTFRDAEIAGIVPYPAGIVRMDVRQRVTGDPMQQFKRAQISLSGSIEVVQGIPRWFGWVAFVRVVQSRLQAVPGIPGKREFITINRLEIEDEIFGNGMSFHLRYEILTDKEHFLQDTGLWRPVPGNWSQWRASMDSLVGLRGAARLRHNASDDVVLNFCSGRDPVPKKDVYIARRFGAIPTPFTCKPPSKEASWRMYVVSLMSGTKSGTILHRPAAPWKDHSKGKLDVSGADKTETFEGYIDVDPLPTSPGELTVQERSPPLILVGLDCVAERVGYPIEPDDLPHLDTIGGQKAVYQDQKVISNRKVGKTACGLSIYRAACIRFYYVTKVSSKYTLRGVPKGAKRLVQGPK